MSALPWDQRLGRRVARSLARTPMTPNQVTTVGLLSGLAAALMYAQGEEALANWAAVLFMLAVFIDHVDGELARMTGTTSRFGHYYDAVASGVSYVGMFVGVGVGLSDGRLGEWTIVLGIVAGVSVFVILSLRVDQERRSGKQAVAQPSFAGFEIEDTLYLVGPVTWAGGLAPFLIASGIGTPIFLLWVLWQWRKSRRGSNAGVGQP